MDAWLRFYGSDWIGMTGTFLGLWFLSKQRKIGFVLGSVGCVGWLAFGIITGSMPSVASNLIYIGMNIRGWRKWKKKPPGQCRPGEAESPGTAREPA